MTLSQDPGNLESDLQAGAQAGYMLCWVLLWSTLLVRFLLLLYGLTFASLQGHTQSVTLDYNDTAAAAQ